jgi:hypothetical protein
LGAPHKRRYQHREEDQCLRHDIPANNGDTQRVAQFGPVANADDNRQDAKDRRHRRLMIERKRSTAAS